MRKLILFIIVVVVTPLSAQTLMTNTEVEKQTTYKFPHIYWKDAKEDLAAGILIGHHNSWGVSLNWWHVYFQVKINQPYSPDPLYWDIAHTHQAGIIFNITKRVELMSGYGYTAFFREFDDDGIDLHQPEGKLKWSYNGGVTYNWLRLKFLAGFTASPFEWHVGVLYNNLKY